MIEIDDIKHVVPQGDAAHALYLEDGRIIRISPVTGRVLSVTSLPSEEEIAAYVARRRGDSADTD